MVRAEGSSCDQMPTVLASVSKIRGLRVKKEVPCRIYTQDMARKFVAERFKEDLVPEEIKLLEAFFRATNLVPKDYDLMKGLAELYVLQLGGFYDPKGKFFAMADWQTLMPVEIVLSHELTHALQDQHFDLEHLMDGRKLTLDEELARQALVEGDATLMMTDFMQQKMGMPPIAKQDNVEGLALQAGMGAAFEQRAPQALVKMLAFPYSGGARFAHALMKAGRTDYGAIDLAFSNPPRTTREILHPEVFIRGEKNIPIVDSVEEGRCTKDSVGEFLTSLLLYQNKIKGFSELARELRGDKVYHCGTVLHWKSAWSDEKNAKNFADTIKNNSAFKHKEILTHGSQVLIRF